MSNDHKFLLKEQFTQQFKYSRYLITTLLTENKVKFCSPQNIF